MMEYDFYKFTPQEFEHLVQGLFQKEFGYESIVYGLGPDGGRELTYGEGSNSVLVQAKFKMRDSHFEDGYQWVEKHFKSEMSKFIENDRLSRASHYIFVTNAVLTPVKDLGGRDKIEIFKIKYQYLFPKITVISYDELCRLIANNRDVRSAFMHLLGLPGDILERIGHNLGMRTNSLLLFGDEIRIKNPNHLELYLPEKQILTIDFGTSFSLASIMKPNGSLTFIPNHANEILVPSIVTFFKDGQYLIGNTGYKYILSESAITISNIKRYLGSKKTYNVFGKSYSVEDIAFLIIKSLKTNAEEYFGIEFSNVLTSKPVDFNLKQTAALKRTFERTGLKVIRIIDEATSASGIFKKISQSTSERTDNELILAIDLGGGTFDVSLVEYSDEVYDTKKILGDNKIGGIDFDFSVLSYVEEEVRMKYPEVNISDYTKYLYEAERVKKDLSRLECTSFIFPDIQLANGNLRDIEITIDRQTFSKITKHLNDRIETYLNRIFYLHGEEAPISLILLTGQGTKIFTVKKIVEDIFKEIKVIGEYSENAVAIGNAEHAGLIAGSNPNFLVINLLNTQLALSTLAPSHTSTNNREFEGEISSDSRKNIHYTALTDREYSIPFKKTLKFLAQDQDRNNVLKLEFYEICKNGKDILFLKAIEVPITSKINFIDVMLEIDPNFNISMTIENAECGFENSIRLN